MANSNDVSGSGNGATTAQLKHDIDSGLTGDKVAGFDPAATPLGVDEEAGGVSPDPALIQAARLAERAGRPARPRQNAATPELAPDGRINRRPALWIAMLIGGAGGVLIGLLLAAIL